MRLLVRDGTVPGYRSQSDTHLGVRWGGQGPSHRKWRYRFDLCCPPGAAASSPPPLGGVIKVGDLNCKQRVWNSRLTTPNGKRLPSIYQENYPNLRVTLPITYCNCILLPLLITFCLYQKQNTLFYFSFV